jgi:hypothetical protein
MKTYGGKRLRNKMFDQQSEWNIAVANYCGCPCGHRGCLLESYPGYYEYDSDFDQPPDAPIHWQLTWGFWEKLNAQPLQWDTLP